MPAIETSQIKTFLVAHPRRNLPPVSSRRRGESVFSRAFQRAFLTLDGNRGLGGREFVVPGYGIADFVWAASKARNGNGNGHAAPVTMTAFEMKLSDWPRALHQAYRYTYFSDRTIVVLPAQVGRAAKEALPLFRDLGVGLWVFKKEEQKITKVFTPRAKSPKNPAARERALATLRRKFDLGGRRK